LLCENLQKRSADYRGRLSTGKQLGSVNLFIINATSWCCEMAKRPSQRSRKSTRTRRSAPAKSTREPAPSELVTRLRAQLAAARRTIADLKLRADTDVLLDLLNRRGFERELRRSISYVKRYRATAAVLFLDVDRLKPINDRLGHAAGDAALKTIAKVLIDHVRMSDIVARLGGDEFGVLLWNLTPDDASSKARELEAAVDQLRLVFQGRKVRVGMAAGITMLSPNDEVSDVIARADQAMYLRKQQRRAARRASALRR
jgi:diguanylate cyclase (GGDEF)-like protein